MNEFELTVPDLYSNLVQSNIEEAQSHSVFGAAFRNGET